LAFLGNIAIGNSLGIQLLILNKFGAPVPGIGFSFQFFSAAFTKIFPVIQNVIRIANRLQPFSGMAGLTTDRVTSLRPSVFYFPAKTIGGWGLVAIAAIEPKPL